MTAQPQQPPNKGELEADQTLYQVRTLGVCQGVSQARAQAGLQAHFKLTAKRASVMLENRIVCKPTSNARARSLKRQLFSLGVRARIEKIGGAISRDKDSRSTRLAHGLIEAITPPEDAVTPDSNYRRYARLTALSSLVAPAVYFSMLVGLVVATVMYGWSAWFPNRYLEMMFYVSVIGTGISMIALLVRPLFSNYSMPRRIRLKRKDAPLLFKLIKQLSIATGAPEPAGIYIDNAVNAYVNSVNGTKGIKRGELELTIGTPLLFGLTGAQLASVIAHEFGHFTQRREMLRSYRVNRVSRWLSICAYQPDSWEIKLQQIADRYEENVGRDLNFWCLAGVLWSQKTTRRFFALLLDLNSHLTGAMSRQMEFNADDHAVAVLGSELYVATEYRLHEMGAVEQYLRSINSSAYQQNRLLRDIPAAIAQKLAQLTEEQRATIKDSIADQTTEFWSTHPATQDRIARSLSLGVPNITAPEFIARELITESAGLGERITMNCYLQDYGLADAEECVTDNEEIFRLERSQNEEDAAFREVFGGYFDGRTPYFSADFEDLPTSAPVAFGARYEDWSQRKERLGGLFVAGVFAGCGGSLESGTWGITDHSIDGIDRAYQQENVELARQRSSIETYDRYMQRRLLEQLKLLGGEKEKEGLQILSWLAKVAAFEPQMEELWLYRISLYWLNDINYDECDQSVGKQLQDKRAIFAAAAIKIGIAANASLGCLEQPLATAREGESVSDFLLSWNAAPLPDCSAAQPADLDYELVFENSRRLHNALSYLVQQALARLAAIAVQVQPESKSRAAA